MVDLNGKHRQGTHSTKMGADKLAKNSPNAQKLICPSPKIWDLDEKRLHWASVVRDQTFVGLKCMACSTLT